MPTRREYLAGLNPPLAKANSRGRLSKAALAKVARAKASGVTFSDEDGGGSSEPSPDPQSEQPTGPVATMKPDPIRRKIKHVEGFTPEGARVQSGICFKCNASVARCACRAGIKASPIVSRWSKDSEKYGAPIDRPGGP